jgi:hypothetical protein
MVKAISMAKNGEDVDGDGDSGQLVVAVMAMVSNYRRSRILHSTAASSVHSATQALHCHRCRPWLQIEDPPHSLQVDRRLPCLQMYAPPQSRHCCRSRPWLQIETPEQSLQRDFCRPWLQKVDPPHSLHADRRLPWGQRNAPPHSLHWKMRRLWQQSDDPPQSLHRDPRRPWLQVEVLLVILTAEADRTGWLLRSKVLVLDTGPSFSF